MSESSKIICRPTEQTVMALRWLLFTHQFARYRLHRRDEASVIEAHSDWAFLSFAREFARIPPSGSSEFKMEVTGDMLSFLEELLDLREAPLLSRAVRWRRKSGMTDCGRSIVRRWVTRQRKRLPKRWGGR